MPLHNQFHHQPYSDTAPTSPHELLHPAGYPSVDSEPFRRRMRNVGRAMTAADVQAIYLAHGTFVGADALGLFAGLGRIVPQLGDTCRKLSKQTVDSLVGDAGNYTPEFAALFEKSLAGNEGPVIPVRLFQWSSENHHLGRADGAVRLIDELASLKLERGSRILLWGHSHAGNVFALVTNLLAGDRAAVEQFFDAARVYYRWPLLGCIDIPLWLHVEQLLLEGPNPLDGVDLDMVTFGTPIRYGWDTAGYAQLMHFVNHRPAAGLPPYRAPFPPAPERVLAAADGDYVQQFGIAGTNFMPSLFAWRSWWADNRLHRLFEPHVSPAGLTERIGLGARVPAEGTTLLVNYGEPAGNLTQHLLGHAVYTRQEWLLFHAEEVARHFYGLDA